MCAIDTKHREQSTERNFDEQIIDIHLMLLSDNVQMMYHLKD